MSRLSGVGVLVTRPAHQAEPLCRLIEAEGASAVRFPALEIHPVADRPAIKAAIGPVDRFSLVVFVSANAVRFGGELLGQRRDLRLAAIGRATAQALNVAGYRVSVLPAGGSDSEALLATSALRHMAGQRVLIVRGRGGRDLLGDTLAERGAEVVHAEVYEREPAHPSRETLSELEELWRHGGIDVYTATSSELLEALVGLVTPRCRELMDSTALLTGAVRVADRAARLGLGSPVILAAAPDDEALVEALIGWCSNRPRPGAGNPP
jgi:uroporphyrinogen-III synthase